MHIRRAGSIESQVGRVGFHSGRGRSSRAVGIPLDCQQGDSRVTGRTAASIGIRRWLRGWIQPHG